MFRENFEHSLTKSDEDLVDILVDLGKKNSMLNIAINEGLNVSNVGDKIPKLVPPETDQNKTAVFNDYSTSEKNSEAIGSFTEDGRLKGFFCSKTVFNLSKKILIEAEIKVLEKDLDFAPIQKTLNEPQLIWTHGTQELDSFLNELNKFHPNLSFTYETSEEMVNFLDLNVQSVHIFTLSLPMDTSISIISHLIQNI